MFFLKLVFRNAFRARLRSALTVLGLVIALVAFGLLQTVVKSWYAGVEMASGTRLITRNSISLVFSLPGYYRDRIRSIEGVRGVAVSNWFGGIWRDERSFFAQFAVDVPNFFAMYPEFRFKPDEWTDLLRDRRGAAIGRQLADLYAFKVGDRLPIRGTIYSGNWDFNIRAIYDARDEGTITRQMYFHYDYLNEYLKLKAPRAADRAGVFVVEVDDAARAAEISRTIDGEFANSLAETLTETEKAFQLSFVAMIETIIQVITGVSFIVILIILAVAANTMAMTARERIGEYATLKALGFGPPFVARLVLAESLVLGAIGGMLAILLTAPVAHGFFELVGKQVFAVFEVAPVTYLWQALSALAVGLLAALVPMIRSASVGIVDGLRHVG
ncbi:MAG TPA: FtsX-like permease family protein [Burkholderiaceae bacterium]|nr:FtsX-like permease family protein [Burkholderiaceae bacterium]